jgi:ribosomal protein S12 methylthiotransferase
MLGRLQERGYAPVADARQADVIVVNTCAFIDKAKQESVDAILEMAREKEQGRAQRLVVTGCLTQRYDAELRKEIPEIDATLGTGQVDDIVRAVEGESSTDATAAPTWVYDHTTPRTLATPPWLAYVKISEGCDYTCSFCIRWLPRRRS